MNYLYSFVVYGFSLLWSFVVSESCTTPLGVYSQCISLYHCRQLLLAIQQQSLRRDIITFLKNSQCGFDGTVPKVCCGPLPTQINRNTTVHTFAIDSKDIDPVFQEDSSPESRTVCGINKNGDRIYGGGITDLDEFSWVVLLGYKKPNEKITYQCGGALINKRYVLTAAHCVVGHIETLFGSLVSVRLGEYNIETEMDCLDDICAGPYQEISVHSAFFHPGYSVKSRKRKYDIALVRLAKRVVYNWFIQPICLPQSGLNLDVKMTTFVAGWGKSLFENGSPVKLKLHRNIFNTSQCAMKYQTLGMSITNGQICVGGEFGKSGCLGDSGGPLMRAGLNGIWEVIGIDSFVYECGIDGWPSVYTSVPYYLDWITETLRSSNV